MIHKIVFLGLNNDTLILLNKNKSFNVIGVNYYEYFDICTLNPFDYIFCLAYKLHYKKKSNVISKLIFKIWCMLSVFSSKIYKENKEYLNCILMHKIEIIDTEDVHYFSSFITSNAIDLLVINSWGIIPNIILTLPKFKTLNIHPSLLPKYRGALPTLWSLKNKDTATALTYIVLNDSIDDGLIVAQHVFSINELDDWKSLEIKISKLLNVTLCNDILNYLNNTFVPIKTTCDPSYTDYYNKYRRIDLLNEYSRDIYNKVGLYPYIEPFFYCYIKILDRKIFLKKIYYYKKINIILVPGGIYLGLGFILFFSKDGILKSYLFKDMQFRDSIFIIFKKITSKI